MPYRVFPHGIDWMERGVCRDMDRKIFDFPILPEAKRACAQCPVQETCLDHLLSWPEQVGYGGGMTEQERIKEAGAREWAERKRKQEQMGHQKVAV